MSKHTPGPWDIQVYFDQRTVTITAPLPTNVSRRVGIARMANACNMETVKANAAHIVKCVNMHDEIIAGLKLLPCECEESPEYGKQACTRCKLLAKAEYE